MAAEAEASGALLTPAASGPPAPSGAVGSAFGKGAVDVDSLLRLCGLGGARGRRVDESDDGDRGSGSRDGRVGHVPDVDTDADAMNDDGRDSDVDEGGYEDDLDDDEVGVDEDGEDWGMGKGGRGVGGHGSEALEKEFAMGDGGGVKTRAGVEEAWVRSGSRTAALLAEGGGGEDGGGMAREKAMGCETSTAGVEASEEALRRVAGQADLYKRLLVSLARSQVSLFRLFSFGVFVACHSDAFLCVGVIPVGGIFPAARSRRRCGNVMFGAAFVLVLSIAPWISYRKIPAYASLECVHRPSRIFRRDFGLWIKF